MTEGQDFLGDCIEAIEKSYEFMLAYAAQGRDFEMAGGAGPSIRGYLTDLKARLEEIGHRFEAGAAKSPLAGSGAFKEFNAVLKADAYRGAKAVALALASGNISSQLVDNLNASLHLRALLTDMFLLDEALRASRAAR